MIKYKLFNNYTPYKIVKNNNQINFENIKINTKLLNLENKLKEYDINSYIFLYKNKTYSFSYKILKNLVQDFKNWMYEYNNKIKLKEIFDNYIIIYSDYGPYVNLGDFIIRVSDLIKITSFKNERYFYVQEILIKPIRYMIKCQEILKKQKFIQYINKKKTEIKKIDPFL